MLVTLFDTPWIPFKIKTLAVGSVSTSREKSTSLKKESIDRCIYIYKEKERGLYIHVTAGYIDHY